MRNLFKNLAWITEREKGARQIHSTNQLSGNTKKDKVKKVLALINELQIQDTSTYTPMIRHVLQGSCMNNKELHNVSTMNKHHFLQKLRYSKTMASEIVTGSPELGGLGFMDFYIEQGLLNIQLLAMALSHHQLVGDIMKAALC